MCDLITDLLAVPEALDDLKFEVFFFLSLYYDVWNSIKPWTQHSFFGSILKKYGTVLPVETSVIIAFTTLLSSFLSF